jgi:hypothetical protein
MGSRSSYIAVNQASLWAVTGSNRRPLRCKSLGLAALPSPIPTSPRIPGGRCLVSAEELPPVVDIGVQILAPVGGGGRDEPCYSNGEGSER